MTAENPPVCPNCSEGGHHTPMRKYPDETYWICPNCGSKSTPVKEPEPLVEAKGVLRINSAKGFRVLALILLIIYGLVLFFTATSAGTALPWWFWAPSLLMFIFFVAILGAVDSVIDAVAELEVYTGYKDTTINPTPPREEKPKVPNSPCAKCGREALSPPYCEECWIEEAGG